VQLPVTTPEGATFMLPMKYLSAGALFFDEQGRLLLVKPTYKEGWEIPGGIVEHDESPKQACLREIKEELGLDVSLGPLLVIDYLSRRDRPSDSLQMVFLGGTLSPATIEAIVLPAAELSEYRFLRPDAALTVLRGSLRLRVAGCLRAITAKQTLLLHDGQEA
jgi:8-oxo-dGTP pyrophosphatase MutT (NUDIX family)